MFYGVLIFVIAVIVAVAYSCIYDIIKSKKIMKDYEDAMNNFERLQNKIDDRSDESR